jgi:polynucleotide kinase-phosphatase
LDGLISHYVLDDGKLVVAHAGLKEDMQGRASGRVRDFALYGETTGETDEFGFPIRVDWAQNYRGKATVVYGHVAVSEPRWLNNTVNIDTGCAFGGQLTALRYPERELVSVPAARTYYEPTRPLAAPAPERDDLLDVSDVLGKRLVESPLAGKVTIREENATAALEVMSRFAIDPHWLIYLPPTMSPTESTSRPGLLEHPDEAFAYYRKHGAERVVCEEKHMGSRAVVIVCRDEESAIERFGLAPRSGIGVCYTRTGRPMFPDGDLERKLLEVMGETLTATGFWAMFNTSWVCLDCELMPWSAKAQELLVDQYAPGGIAATTSLGLAAAAVGQAIERGVDLQVLHDDLERRETAAAEYVEAYGRYCWPVNGVDDLRVALSKFSRPREPPISTKRTNGTCNRRLFLPELEPRSSLRPLSRLSTLRTRRISATRLSGGLTSPRPGERAWSSSRLSSSRRPGVASSRGSSVVDLSTCASSTAPNTTCLGTWSSCVTAARSLSSGRSLYVSSV